MKTSIPFSLILAAASAGMAFGAETAYTVPVGYATTTLKQGYNNVGITLQLPIRMAGSFEVVTPGTLKDTTAGVDFLTALGATGVLHILEITSGLGKGLVIEVSTWTADSITTVDNLVSAGVVAGDTYRIRKAPTLEEIFTTNTTTGPLTSGSAGTADLVYVPTATPGQYTQYFLSAAGVFRSVVPAVAAPNVPLVYLDGIFVQRKALGTKDLVIAGEVKTDKTMGRLVPGFNYLGLIYPAGLTLQNSGLETSVLAGSAATADLIYIPSQLTTGQYTQVFRSTTGVWRTVVPAAVAPVIDLTGAIFIERKGAATAYSITPPSTWSIAP